MTVRTLLVAEFFRRCRDEPDGTGAEWVAGWPGDQPPRERVWLSDIEGDLLYPVSSAPSAENPLIVQDRAMLTLTAASSTGGLDRLTAMANAERYLSAAILVARVSPDLGGAVEGTSTLTITPRQLRGPYSLPNTVESGFMAMAELDLELVTRPD